MPKSKSKSKSQSVKVMKVDPVVRDGKEEKVEGAGEEEEGEGEGEGEGEAEVDEEEEEGEGENEFEVDAILDHKQSNGKYGYLVSWKGYGPEHNTWEPEEHVSHAEEVRRKYWEAKPKTNNTTVQRGKRGRASVGSVTSVPPSQRKTKMAKTANGSTKCKSEPVEVDDELAVPPSQRKTKMAKTANGSTKRKSEPVEVDDELEEVGFEQSHVDMMDRYEGFRDWEDLVESVDTIERASDGTLKVYLTMTGGERAGQATEVAYNRCPQKILRFYEAHLKWKRRAQ